MQLLLLCVLQLYLFKLLTNIKKEKTKTQESCVSGTLSERCAPRSSLLVLLSDAGGEIDRKLNPSLSRGFKRENSNNK